MIRTSHDINNLSAALVKAQAEMPTVPKQTKGQVGNQVRYYADLATVVEVVQPILAKHDLAYVQFPGNDNGMVAVTTRLFHESGQWIEGTLLMPSGGNGAQGVGSALSYARRYSLMAVLGLAPEDDDGAGASQPAAKPRAASRPQPAPPADDAPPPDPNAMTPAQLKKLQALMNEKGYVDRDRKLELLSEVLGRTIETTKGLNRADAGTLIDAIEKMGPLS